MIGLSTNSVSIGRLPATDAHIVVVLDSISEPKYAFAIWTFLCLFVN